MIERSRWWLVCFALVGTSLGGLAACHGGDSNASAAGANAGSGGGGGGSGGGSGSAARVVPVQVAQATRQDLPIWLEGLGTVAAYQQVTVRVQVDGRLDKVLFTEGQTVKRGEVLAQVDSRPFYVMLHQAEGQLARDKAVEKNAQIAFKRNQDLRTQNLIAQATVDQSAADLGSAQGTVQIDQSAIENAQLQLDYAAVKSPLDGITGVRLIDAGNIVHATDTTGLVVVTAIDPVAVLFTVPQDKLMGVTAALAHGDVDVEVWNRDGTAKLSTGKLTVLDNQINQTTATLRMKAIVNNPTHTLWPNAFVKARMLLETRTNALVVPTVAVQQGPSGNFVYVVDQDHKAQMTPVEVSLTSGDLAVISKGLNGGESVITEGQNQVRPGGKVAPSAKGGPPAAEAAPGAAGAGSGGGSGAGHRHHGAGSGSDSGSGSGSGAMPAAAPATAPASPPATTSATVGPGAPPPGPSAGSASRSRSTVNPTPNIAPQPAAQP